MSIVINCFVVLIPAVMAALIYYGENLKTIKTGKLLLSILLWMIGINVTLYAGLLLVSINLFELTGVGIGFKFKYLMLEILLAGGVLFFRNMLNKDRRKESIKNIVRILPETIFLIITYAVFAPSSLFLSNIDEFSISYGKIVPVLLAVSFLLLAAMVITAVLLVKEGWVLRWKTLIFSVALGFYLQSNFLNPALPELNGIAINWEQYVVSGIVSTLVWLLCVIGLQVAVSFWKERVTQVSKYASWFISAVQVVTLVVLLLTTTDSKGSNIALLKEDEFTVGSGNNVVIFVLDSLGGAKLEEVLAEDEQIKEKLSDFTFFTNTVSGGAYTSVGMPMFLTGMEFDSSWKNYDDYLQEAWSEVELYDDLKEQNFDIRIFTDGRYLTNVSEDVITNAMYVGDSYYIEDYMDFAKDMYQFTSFYAMPQLLKQSFWMYSDDITRQIKTTGWEKRQDENELAVANGADNYSFDDVQFYQDFLNAGGLEVKYVNTYRLYHLFGAHEPYTMNENAEYAISDEIRQIKGSMKIVDEYIEELRRLNLYDSSTIIITADHGRGKSVDGIQQNPCLLIKTAQEKHELVYNDAPIHFRNVMATIAKAFVENYTGYGPSVYDIDENSDVERLHTAAAPVRGDLFPEIADEVAFSRFIISEDARDVEAIEIYYPDKINAFDYCIGDVIDFTEESEYSDQINYRLYKENGTGIASTELALYMRLQDYEGGDLNLQFEYSHVYNDIQGMSVYVAGEKAADITCKTEDVGKPLSVFIKEQYVKDNVLPIRLVFRNAVTPKMIGESETDTRVLSVAFDSIKVSYQE